MTAQKRRASDQPRVAVVVPCYRDGELAAEAVASVRENEPVELVVVDDGSDDAPTLAALERMESEGVQVLRHEQNRGLSAARNTGVAATSARYVFPLDSDDLAIGHLLRAMADRLDEDPGAGVCFGDYEEFGTAHHIRAVPARIDPYRLAYTNEYPVSALFERDVLEAVGGWAPIEAYEDWHMWMTLAERGVTGVHFGFGVITFRKRVQGSTDALEGPNRSPRPLFPPTSRPSATVRRAARVPTAIPSASHAQTALSGGLRQAPAVFLGLPDQERAGATGHLDRAEIARRLWVTAESAAASGHGAASDHAAGPPSRA
jgi:hypothetical protein